MCMGWVRDLFLKKSEETRNKRADEKREKRQLQEKLDQEFRDFDKTIKLFKEQN